MEADAKGMRAALAGNDEVLCKAIEAHGGFLFKHTGDGEAEMRDGDYARRGETMTTAAMVTYAYDQIDQARPTLEHSG